MHFSVPETNIVWSHYATSDRTIYVNVCLAQGIYSVGYLKKQIISGSAPPSCGTRSSFAEIFLAAGKVNVG